MGEWMESLQRLIGNYSIQLLLDIVTIIGREVGVG